MPSPFPGMDPYLEDPGLWPDVHHEMISTSRVILGNQLRPKYVVRVEERIYLIGDDERPISMKVSDTQISARPGWEGGGRSFEQRGGVDVIEPILATRIPFVADEVREARLEIIHRESKEVVAVIEFLSPANKSNRSPGAWSFERKRMEVDNSDAHWVEIDLLRAGVRVEMKEKLSPHEYLVYVSKAEERPVGKIWPIRLSQRLPVIAIPLRGDDPDTPLDLQEVLATIYERAGYDLTVDYTKEPNPPLGEEWAEWSNSLLKAKGLRPA